MPSKLVVVAHGIGDHAEDFHLEWEQLLRAAHPDGEFDVLGLHWDDVLDEVASHYDIVNERFADAVARFGFSGLKDLLEDDDYRMVHEHVMDVLVYCGLDEMRHFVQSRCILKLARHCLRREKRSILIGHSLGAAVLPHIVTLEKLEVGSIQYRGMILLASPLGMESPAPSLIKDPLRATPGAAGRSRIEVLRDLSFDWRRAGEGRIHFLCNTNDIVCSDVRMTVADGEVDLIPVRQGFTDKEVKTIERFNPGAVVRFKAGEPKPDRIADNHAVRLYLERPEFASIFKNLVDT